MIEFALYSFLSNVTAITALVGDRITPMERGQGEALPAVTYQTISNVPDYHLGGESGHSAARIQIDCWADTYLAVKQLAEEVRLAVSGHVGTWNEHAITGVLVEDNGDLPESVDPASEAGPHRASMDLRIGYLQTAATP